MKGAVPAPRVIMHFISNILKAVRASSPSLDSWIGATDPVATIFLSVVLGILIAIAIALVFLGIAAIVVCVLRLGQPKEGVDVDVDKKHRE